MAKEPILFFDGLCGFCNKTIDYFISKDTKKKIRYAPLQGKTASRLLSHQYTQDLDTIVLHIDGKIYTKSKAILKSFALLEFPYSFMQVFLIIPSPITNYFYSIIAKYRYKIFGKSDTCRIPSAEERTLFLD